MSMKFLKHILEIHRELELIEVMEYQNVFFSDFCQKWSNVGQILIRLLRKNWSDIQSDLRSFSQILIISTLGDAVLQVY